MRSLRGRDRSSTGGRSGKSRPGSPSVLVCSVIVAACSSSPPHPVWTRALSTSARGAADLKIDQRQRDLMTCTRVAFCVAFTKLLCCDHYIRCQCSRITRSLQWCFCPHHNSKLEEFPACPFAAFCASPRHLAHTHARQLLLPCRAAQPLQLERTRPSTTPHMRKNRGVCAPP